MEPDGDSPPIWSPPSTLFVPIRRRRHLSSILNPVTFAIAFSIILIFIIFFLLPPILSRNNQVPKPNTSVKKSWDSINIFLVLFAVLCGVFARRNDETSSSDGAETVPNVYEFVDSGRQSVSGADWLEFPDRKDNYDYKMSNHKNTSAYRLRRSSSSYPDLRQESLWGSDGEKFKVFDDFEVDFHRHVRQTHQVEKDFVAETPVREIPVDKFELKNSVPPPPTQPLSQVPQPPPPPPPPPVKRRRSVHSVPKQYNVGSGGHETEFDKKRSSLPPPSRTTPPPPPPPPGLKFHPLAERREKIQKKKSGTTKEIATAIVSLYQGTQKNKKKVKTRDIFESVAQNSSPPTLPAPSSISSSPPPPPPPPPSKVLQNLFKKSSKSKRVHSVSTTNPPPPPPPPPPPNSIFNNIFKTGSKSKRFQSTSASSQPPPPPPPPPPPSSIFNSIFKNGTKSRRFKYTETQPPPPLPSTPGISLPKHSPANTGKPPKPTKPSTSHHESVVIAPASPLIPMPPPPPPPPFTMPEMKFIAKGDFVRIRSANSSRCSSPGREDFDVMSVKSDGGDSIGTSFTCPSPDVDTKADAFILRRRDEWRLEKINSLKEQRNTGSSSARLSSYA